MQYWNNITKNILTVFTVVIISKASFAQENSPYSRYGIGNLKQIENVSSRGMGGVAIADDNALSVNPTNPATYTGLRLTSYQFAIEGISSNIKNLAGQNRVGATTISYVNIGFALSKKMGMSFGLMPVTRSKYQMQDVTSFDSLTQLTRSYYGGGGVQRIYVGAAYKIKDFSIGLNTGYNFGNLVNTTESEFTDTVKLLSSFNSSRITMGGVFWQLGGLFTKNINEEISLNIGLTYTGQQQINAKKSQEWGSFLGDLSDVENNYLNKIDSIQELKGKIKIPGLLAAGVLLKKGDYWQIGADFNTSNWANFRSYGNADSTGKSWIFKLGGAITPDVNSVTSSLKRMTYRLGAFYGQDIFQFNGNAMNKTAITTGVGYPVRRTNLSVGSINAAMEIGKRGSVENGMIREGYTRFSVGLTLNDKWFIKRKYD